MPVINRPKKKRQKAGANASISKIYNTPEWKKLRDWQIYTHPLCEDCLNENIINEDGTYGQCLRCAEEVHHIVPISTGGDELKMKDIAYNADNLVSLCRFHHHLRHKN